MEKNDKGVGKISSRKSMTAASRSACATSPWYWPFSSPFFSSSSSTASTWAGTTRKMTVSKDKEESFSSPSPKSKTRKSILYNRDLSSTNSSRQPQPQAQSQRRKEEEKGKTITTKIIENQISEHVKEDEDVSEEEKKHLALNFLAWKLAKTTPG